MELQSPSPTIPEVMAQTPSGTVIKWEELAEVSSLATRYIYTGFVGVQYKLTVGKWEIVGVMGVDGRLCVCVCVLSLIHI